MSNVGEPVVAHRVIVRGRVQGVGFRYFVYRKASSLGVYGWVKNLFSGDVEAQLEGPVEDVKRLEDMIRRGPSFSFVSDLVIRDVPVEGFETFSIER